VVTTYDTPGPAQAFTQGSPPGPQLAR